MVPVPTDFVKIDRRLSAGRPFACLDKLCYALPLGAGERYVHYRLVGRAGPLTVR